MMQTLFVPSFIKAMVIIELYSKCLKIKYKNCIFSEASFFIAVTTLLNLAIPFVFSYNSGGFWLKHDTFYEQPDVKFKGEYLFIAHTNNISLSFVCNNFAYYDADTFEDSCSEIKAAEFDNNFDGKVDTFTFELNLNLPESTSITRFDLLLTLDYKLTATCGFHMQSLVLLQEMVRDINLISVSSILKLSQLFPINCHPKIINTNYNASIIDVDNDESYKFNNIIDKYYQRNVTTHLLPTVKTYENQEEDLFSLKVDIKYPEHTFYYTPTFWQVMKWAWIQYVSVYIILWWVIRKIKDYVFNNRIVVFYELNPIKCKED